MKPTQKQALSVPVDPHRFIAFERTLELVRSLRSIVVRLERRDRELAKQLRTAATSIGLNLAEGRKRTGKDRLHLFRVAAGSAEETRGCLRIAEAWGYVVETDIAEALEHADAIVAILATDSLSKSAAVAALFSRLVWPGCCLLTCQRSPGGRARFSIL